MHWRPARSDDHDRIVQWNRELQIDEGAAPGEPAAIAARLRRWLDADYAGLVLELGAGPIGYALYRPTHVDHERPGGVYLRQFFIARDHRRAGNGSRAFRLFVDEVVCGRRLVLDVLESNRAGQAFWTSLGLCVYSQKLELLPDRAR